MEEDKIFEPIHPKEVFDVVIATDNVQINLLKISRRMAVTVCKQLLLDHPDDQNIQEHLKECFSHFGFMSRSGPGYDFNISGYVPIIKGEEKTYLRKKERNF